MDRQIDQTVSQAKKVGPRHRERGRERGEEQKSMTLTTECSKGWSYNDTVKSQGEIHITHMLIHHTNTTLHGYSKNSTQRPMLSTETSTNFKTYASDSQKKKGAFWAKFGQMTVLLFGPVCLRYSCKCCKNQTRHNYMDDVSMGYHCFCEQQVKG